jgi:hypothetical protein
MNHNCRVNAHHKEMTVMGLSTYEAEYHSPSRAVMVWELSWTVTEPLFPPPADMDQEEMSDNEEEEADADSDEL